MKRRQKVHSPSKYFYVFMLFLINNQCLYTKTQYLFATNIFIDDVGFYGINKGNAR